MKKLYDKNELRFSLIWIVLYIVLFSLADGVSSVIGISKIVTVPVSVLMTVIIYYWICKNGLKDHCLFLFQANIAFLPFSKGSTIFIARKIPK